MKLKQRTHTSIEKCFQIKGPNYCYKVKTQSSQTQHESQILTTQQITNHTTVVTQVDRDNTSHQQDTWLPAAVLLYVIERIPLYQCGNATERSFLLLNCTGHHKSKAEYSIYPSNTALGKRALLGIRGKTHLLSFFKNSLLTPMLRQFASS